MCRCLVRLTDCGTVQLFDELAECLPDTAAYIDDELHCRELVAHINRY